MAPAVREYLGLKTGHGLLVESVVDVVTHLGDYTFGLAVHPSGEKVYASNSGYVGPDLADFVSVIGFPGGVIAGRFQRGDVNLDGNVRR